MTVIAPMIIRVSSVISSSSTAISPKITEASPRGPNQPTNSTVRNANRLPTNAIATGSMRSTVSESTAKITPGQLSMRNSWATPITPNRAQTAYPSAVDTHAASCRGSSAASAATTGCRAVGRVKAAANAVPAMNAATNPLACHATDP